ncbi:hypothetical protein TNCV_1069381, partial [Trichonephila clavipes]
SGLYTYAQLLVGVLSPQTGSHNGQRRAGTPLTIGEACLKSILSPRPVSREWDYRIQEGRDGDFCGLPMRRYDDVDPPWCLKRFFLGNERRALDGENLRRAPKKRLGRWRIEIGVERKGETMNAGGVGGLESMV